MFAIITNKVCDTCGDVGFADCLAVCSQCKEGAEHIYCMKTIPEGTISPDWVCQRCLPKIGSCSLQVRAKDASTSPDTLADFPSSSQDTSLEEPSHKLDNFEKDKGKLKSHDRIPALYERKVLDEETRNKTVSRQVIEENHKECKLKDKSLTDSRVLKSDTCSSMISRIHASDCTAEPKLNQSIHDKQEQNYASFGKNYLMASNPVSASSTGRVVHGSNYLNAIDSFEVQKCGHYFSSVADNGQGSRFKGNSTDDTDVKNVNEKQEYNDMEDVTKESISSNDSNTTSLKASDSLDTCSAMAADSTLYGIDAEKQTDYSLATYIHRKLHQKAPTYVGSNTQTCCQQQLYKRMVDGRDTERLVPVRTSYEHLKRKGSSIDGLSSVKRASMEIVSQKKSVGAVDPRLSSYRCSKCNKQGHLEKMCSTECIEPNKNDGTTEFLHDRSTFEKIKLLSNGFPHNFGKPNQMRLDSKCKRNSDRRVGILSPPKMVDAVKERQYSNAIYFKQRGTHEKHKCSEMAKLDESIQVDERFSARLSSEMFKKDEEHVNRSNNWRDACRHQPQIMSRFDSSKRAMTNVILDDRHMRSTLKSESHNPTYGEKFPIHASPDVKILWSGSLLVNWSDSRSCYKGFKAHPSSFANPKVRETMRNLPATLTLEVLKRGKKTDTWPKTFQEHPPSSDCIGVYFFPVDMESYAMWYKRLLDRVSTQDLVLRFKLDVAQLLIFPSCLLPKEEQRWNQKHFLWGVFRANKIIGKTITDGKLPQLASVNEVDSGFPLSDNGEVIDMEIDMIGGTDIQ